MMSINGYARTSFRRITCCPGRNHAGNGEVLTHRIDLACTGNQRFVRNVELPRQVCRTIAGESVIPIFANPHALDAKNA